MNNDILMQSLSKILKLVFIQRSKYVHGKQTKGTRTEYSEILNVYPKLQVQIFRLKVMNFS